MNRGFTLIELSIVLVIIGLIIGGVLVGQDLIVAATVRAQVTQIEKYNTAVNTFKAKYNALPGDIPDPYANNFGLNIYTNEQRGGVQGTGDGNGIIEASGDGVPIEVYSQGGFCEETTVFWRDLSTAKLIDGTFVTAAEDYPTPGFLCDGLYGSVSSSPPGITPSQLYPQAKIGNSNFVYVWSGGIVNGNPQASGGNGINYYGIAQIPGPMGTGNCCGMASQPGLTPIQAYGMDKKVDDGYPQTGSIIAVYMNFGRYWAKGGGSASSPVNGDSPGSTTNRTTTTCYDNNGNSGAIEQYSIGDTTGNNINCALSFRFQ